MNKETSIKELTKIIVKAIQDEPYFSKEALIPKVIALISGFRLKLASNNYEKIKNKTQTVKLIRSIELHNLEKNFWIIELRKLVGNDKLKQLYKELDDQRKLWGEQPLP